MVAEDDSVRRGRENDSPAKADAMSPPDPPREN